MERVGVFRYAARIGRERIGIVRYADVAMEEKVFTANSNPISLCSSSTLYIMI